MFSHEWMPAEDALIRERGAGARLRQQLSEAQAAAAAGERQLRQLQQQRRLGQPGVAEGPAAAEREAAEAQLGRLQQQVAGVVMGQWDMGEEKRDSRVWAVMDVMDIMDIIVIGAERRIWAIMAIMDMGAEERVWAIMAIMDTGAEQRISPIMDIMNTGTEQVVLAFGARLGRHQGSLVDGIGCRAATQGGLSF